MSLTAADARRWLEDFEAAELADYESRRSAGPQPQRSIALALSLIIAARRANGGQSPVDPRRPEQVESVRDTWDRLRSRLLR